MQRELGPAFKVWLVLVGATLLSFIVQIETREPSHLVGSAALLIAFFKVRLIGLRYMELRDAALPLRLAFEAWAIALLAILLLLFWLGG